MLQLEQMAPQKGRRTSILQPHEINSNRFKILTVDYQEGEFLQPPVPRNRRCSFVFEEQESEASQRGGLVIEDEYV